MGVANNSSIEERWNAGETFFFSQNPWAASSMGLGNCFEGMVLQMMELGATDFVEVIPGIWQAVSLTREASKLETAKAIFLAYGGSSFHMARDLVFDKYQVFNIPRETEREWAADEKRALLSHFRGSGLADSKAHQLVGWLSGFPDQSDLGELLSLIELKMPTLDTFTGVRLCEDLLWTLTTPRETGVGVALVDRMKIVMAQLLDVARKEPFKVDPFYLNKPIIPQSLTIDAIKQRINSLSERVGWK